MGEIEGEEVQKPGELLYTSPECPCGRQSLARGLCWLIWVCCFVLLLVWLREPEVFGVSGVREIYVPLVLLLFWLSTPIFLTSLLTRKHFCIYATGLSFPEGHRHVFIPCNTFENSKQLGGSSSRIAMLRWENMRYFEHLQGEGSSFIVVQQSFKDRVEDQAKEELGGSLVFPFIQDEEGQKAEQALLSVLQEHEIQEKQMNREPGEIVYSSPECSVWRKIPVQGLALFFLFGFLVILKGVVSSGPDWEGVLGFFFVLISGLVLATLAYTSIVMNPHFRIYDNGLSFPSEHYHPFSSCNRFDNTAKRKGILAGMKMICWEDMRFFEEEMGHPRNTIFLYLDRRYPSTPAALDSPFAPVRYDYLNNEKGLEPRNALLRALKEHGIPKRHSLKEEEDGE